MNAANRLPLILLLWLGLVPFVSAQPTPFRYELLNLLPDDFAVCVVVTICAAIPHAGKNGLRSRRFVIRPLGKSALESPEMAEFNHWQAEMKKHLDLDWPTLRDDFCGATRSSCPTRRAPRTSPMMNAVCFCSTSATPNGSSSSSTSSTTSRRSPAK